MKTPSPCAQAQRSIETPVARLPRFTSYPTALEFGPDFGAPEWAEALAASNTPRKANDLGLYLHIPYCRSLCWYCGCNKVVTQRDQPIRSYLDSMLHEIDHVAERLSRDRKVRLIQMGGGTPNILSQQQFQTLFDRLSQRFTWTESPDIGVELDSRLADAEQLQHLAALGVNRISFGVQDLDPDVQEAINRVQSTEHLLSLIQTAKQLGFASVNVDLVYGLPLQTQRSMAESVQHLITAGADRFALFEYAHAPQMFRAQKLLERQTIPDPEQAQCLFTAAKAVLLAQGMEAIGLDHFARPEDPLCVAQREHRLRRGFQGYFSGAGMDLIGFGASAISELGSVLAQNHRSIPDYRAAIARGGLATFRGRTKTTQDRVRGGWIEQLMCNGSALFNGVEGDDSRNAWSQALQRLEQLPSPWFHVRDEQRIAVCDSDMAKIRLIASAFDAYRPWRP